MKIVTLAAAAAVGIAGVTSTSGAQKTRAPEAPRVAGIAPAPQPPPPPSRSQPSRHSGNVFLGAVPVIVFTDGRVFADFGRGYEQVVNVCSAGNAFVAQSPGNGVVQPSVVQPAVVQPTIPPPTEGVRPQPANPARASG